MTTKVTKPLLIEGGRIIDPARNIDEVSDLLISEGKIMWQGKPGMTPPLPDYDIVSAKGLVVCPGFIDLHCHLRQPGFEEKETIATGTRAAAKGGFTTICCMANTNPPIDTKETVDYVKSVSAAEGVVRVLPIGCVTKGRDGEEIANMAELAAAGVVAFSDDGNPVLNKFVMIDALDNSVTLDLPVIEHCENTEFTRGGQINEGEIAGKLGLRGMPPGAEEFIINRDVLLKNMTQGKLHLAHISCEGSVNAIRSYKKQGVKFTAEVTPHHLTLTEELVLGYNTNAKVNPPLRTQKDKEALIQGLKDGTIDIIATDHAPHTEADKKCQFGMAAFGISVFETAFGSVMKLVHEGHITLPFLISKLTSEPAKIIGGKFGTMGTLAEGSPADITIFDPDFEWTVDPAAFLSKGKNTPLSGATLKGRVMATLYNGNFVSRRVPLN